ncbi:MAG: GNAT family N-acetyltransferase [Clostridiales bacterium]|nr:GNAT family N-acetyltransferase [Clostridiales bacterium]
MSSGSTGAGSDPAAMLYLKKAGAEDGEAAYRFFSELPAEENGFTNEYRGLSREEFLRTALPEMMNQDRGIGLPPGFVPATSYFLWEDDRLVGLFRLRHTLNQTLREGAGHIGYSIAPEYRGKGYATRGLGLLVELAGAVVREEELWLSVRRENAASLAVQRKNGAYLHHADQENYYTRIPLRKA